MWLENLLNRENKLWICYSFKNAYFKSIGQGVKRKDFSNDIEGNNEFTERMTISENLPVILTIKITVIG